MRTRRMKKLKEEKSSTTTTTRMGNPSDQSQLSEEEKNAIEREKIAMQRVFEILLVVEEIIDNLKFTDLKTCRHVCSMWKETATKFILKRDCSQVMLIYGQWEGKFGKGLNNQRILKQYSLTGLTKIIEKSSPFPSSTLTINGGSLGGSELMDFFKAGGKGIKTLKLDWVMGTSLEDLSEILEVHCPNLETLRLNLPTFESTSIVQIQLPKLRVFSAEYFSAFRPRNLSAPNLEVIEDFNLQLDTTDVMKAGKIHTVKELVLTTTCRPEKLQEFVSGNPRIERLAFLEVLPMDMVDEIWKTNFAGPLQQLLDTCKDTIKFLTFSGLGFLFENMKFGSP